MCIRDRDRICKISVKEAKNGDQVIPGQALIAPGDKQMKVVKVGTHYTAVSYTHLPER